MTSVASSEPQQEPVPLLPQNLPIPHDSFPEQYQDSPETDRSDYPDQLQTEPNGTLFVENPENLSLRQLDALPHLIGSGSQTQKAKDAGIGKTTLYRWLQNPDFRAALERLRRETLNAAEARIQAMTYDAANVVHEIMHHGGERVRLQAALAALKFAQEIENTRQLADRMEDLEKSAEIWSKSQWPGI